MNRKSNYISSEKLILSFHNGIKLVDPGNNSCLGYTVADVLKLPINVYFMDLHSKIKDINEYTLSSCGFDSKKSAMGNTTAIVATKETAEFEFRHDQEVLKSGQHCIKEEYYHRLADDIDFPSIAIKLPWYDQHNNVKGIFGCSITMGKYTRCSLAEALTAITRIGLLTQTLPPNKILPGKYLGNIYLSQRQNECLQLLLQGKTSKQIGRILELSHRTVEYYFEHIKTKLGVFSKAGLIEKAMPYYYFAEK